MGGVLGTEGVFARAVVQALSVFLAFFVMGFVDAVGVLVGYARAEFGLSGVAAALLPLLGFAAFALVSVPAGLWASRHGKRLTLAIGLLIVFLGEAVPTASVSSYGWLLAAIGLLGIGMAIVQVAANPLVRDVSEPDRYARNLSFAQFVKSLGSNTGPLLVPAVVALGWGWTAVFPIFGAITALALVALLAARIREYGKPAFATLGTSLSLLRDREVAGWVLAIFLYVGAEVGMTSWIASHMHATFGLPLGSATRYIGLFLGGLAVGRLIGSAVLAIVSPRGFLVGTTVVGLFATAALLLPSSTLASIALVVAGLAYANVWPLVFAIALEKRPVRAAEISGLLCTAILGGALVPFAMGIVADVASPRAAFVLPVACFVSVVRIARRR